MTLKNTPLTLLTLTLFLGALPAQAQEATDLGGGGVDALTKTHNDLNGIINDSVSKLTYIQRNVDKCSSMPGMVDAMLLKPFKDKLTGYKKHLESEFKKLNAGILSKKDSFESVNACVGYKATAIADFKAKQKEIIRARDALYKLVAKPSLADANELYYDKKVKLQNYTGYEVAIKTLSRDSSVPECPDEVVARFRAFAQPNSKKAQLNIFNAKMDGLSALLNNRHNEIAASVASIENVKCDSVAEGVAPVKERPVVASDIVVAPVVKPEVVTKPEVVAPVVAESAPVVENPPVKTATGSSPVVGAILAEQVKEETKLAGLNQLKSGNGPTEIPLGGEPVTRGLAAITPVKAEPEALTANDRWAAPDWKKYDAYKASINAPNKVADVNLGQHYTQFLSSNSMQVRSEEDALRLQKAINAASMQVNGDGVGVSVYQDGRVGSRTMSAAYMMQNDPVYRPVFLAELRKQGLIQ